MSHARAILTFFVVTGAIAFVGVFTNFTPKTVRAKTFGGTASTTLDHGMKLVNVTWKNSNLWYLVRPMRPGEVAERYEFREDSTFGALKGTVVIQEQASIFPPQ